MTSRQLLDRLAFREIMLKHDGGPGGEFCFGDLEIRAIPPQWEGCAVRGKPEGRTRRPAENSHPEVERRFYGDAQRGGESTLGSHGEGRCVGVEVQIDRSLRSSLIGRDDRSVKICERMQDRGEDVEDGAESKRMRIDAPCAIASRVGRIHNLRGEQPGALEPFHVIEKFHRKDYGHMDLEITIDDPKAYTKPWIVNENPVLQPDDELIEYICEENNRDVGHYVGK